eukprot:6177722-Pleurochrysis_carterae.AAC.2
MHQINVGKPRFVSPIALNFSYARDRPRVRGAAALRGRRHRARDRKHDDEVLYRFWGARTGPPSASRTTCFSEAETASH